jgi:nucleoside-diphosphate-sugar epimerase
VYEGCSIVNSIHQECPLRPYGEWKLKQEEYLTSRDVFARIYRVSSAFGKGLAHHRKGLVLALIESAFSTSTVNIHAQPSTLRDFVYDDDIAFHVARKILNQSGHGVEIVASGKPTSVDSLIKQVQNIIRRPVNASFRATTENDRNIVFRKNVLARYFRVTPLEESLRLLISRFTSFA